MAAALPPWLGSARGWTGSQGSHCSLASPINPPCSERYSTKEAQAAHWHRWTAFSSLHFLPGKEKHEESWSRLQASAPRRSHPSSLSCSPGEGTAVLPSVWLRGREFPMVNQPSYIKVGSGSGRCRGAHPTSGYCASEMQSVLVWFSQLPPCPGFWSNGFDKRLSHNFWVLCQEGFIQIKLPFALVPLH